MSTTSRELEVGGIEIDVVFKRIKNLHVSVYPPAGRVRVSAPEQLTDDQIRLAVSKRLPWIRRQRDQLRSAERQTRREMVTGESHYVWGRRTRLKVVEQAGSPQIVHNGERLIFYASANLDEAVRREKLENWYRLELRTKAAEYLDRWVPIVGEPVSAWGVRRMKTKWGSCNAETRRMTFNTELAKKHPACLEYVVVHELVHLKERHHNDRFRGLMDGHLPQWRSLRDELNSAPLAHEDWQY